MLGGGREDLGHFPAPPTFPVKLALEAGLEEQGATESTGLWVKGCPGRGGSVAAWQGSGAGTA